MAKRNTLREFNEFVCYRAIYESYEQAKHNKAVYSTTSAIDALTIQSDCTTGFFDLGEILSIVELCYGDGELVWGVLDQNNNFVSWEDAAYAIKNS